MRKAYKEKGFEDLLLKQENYSKGSNLQYGELKMRSYLRTQEITREQASLVFRFRTRMVTQIKANFKSTYKDNISCPICPSGEDDSQEHLITCSSLTNDDITLQEYRSLNGSDEEKISNVIKKLERILKERKQLLDTK